MLVESDLGISNPASEQKGMGTLGPRAFWSKSKIYLSILTLKRNLYICIYVYMHMFISALKEKEILFVT